MLEEAKKFTKEHHMIEEGSRVIAGVSGGADSGMPVASFC